MNISRVWIAVGIFLLASSSKAVGGEASSSLGAERSAPSEREAAARASGGDSDPAAAAEESQPALSEAEQAAARATVSTDSREAAGTEPADDPSATADAGGGIPGYQAAASDILGAQGGNSGASVSVNPADGSLGVTVPVGPRLPLTGGGQMGITLGYHYHNALHLEESGKQRNLLDGYGGTLSTFVADLTAYAHNQMADVAIGWTIQEAPLLYIKSDQQQFNASRTNPDGSTSTDQDPDIVYSYFELYVQGAVHRFYSPTRVTASDNVRSVNQVGLYAWRATDSSWGCKPCTSASPTLETRDGSNLRLVLDALHATYTVQFPDGRWIAFRDFAPENSDPIPVIRPDQGISHNGNPQFSYSLFLTHPMYPVETGSLQGAGGVTYHYDSPPDDPQPVQATTVSGSKVVYDDTVSSTTYSKMTYRYWRLSRICDKLAASRCIGLSYRDVNSYNGDATLTVSIPGGEGKADLAYTLTIDGYQLKRIASPAVWEAAAQKAVAGAIDFTYTYTDPALAWSGKLARVYPRHDAAVTDLATLSAYYAATYLTSEQLASSTQTDSWSGFYNYNTHGSSFRSAVLQSEGRKVWSADRVETFQRVNGFTVETSSYAYTLAATDFLGSDQSDHSSTDATGFSYNWTMMQSHYGSTYATTTVTDPEGHRQVYYISAGLNRLP